MLNFFVARFFKNKVLNPPLKNIEIEINSLCNRRCRYCPNFNHTRDEVFLEEELFYKIINELKNIGFKGKLAFSMFNEPLLDKRLPRFIAHVKKELPSVYTYLNTNGDFLTLPLWKELREAGLDFANVTQYDAKINKNVEEILHALSPDEKKYLYVHPLDYINNRAGLVKTGHNIKLPIKEYCHCPFDQISVNYKGKVVLCANDYLGIVEIGDLRSESIVDLWESKVFKDYRKKLFFKDRSHLKLCESCDYIEDRQ